MKFNYSAHTIRHAILKEGILFMLANFTGVEEARNSRFNEDISVNLNGKSKGSFGDQPLAALIQEGSQVLFEWKDDMQDHQHPLGNTIKAIYLLQHRNFNLVYCAGEKPLPL